MNEKELNQKRKEAFAKFIKRNPDACSADYETWHQVWDELVKLFATPDVVGHSEQLNFLINEAVEKEKNNIRQFLIDEGYELLSEKI